jgi:hypothetical protein
VLLAWQELIKLDIFIVGGDLPEESYPESAKASRVTHKERK